MASLTSEKTHWHTLRAQDAVDRLGSAPATGLMASEASHRLEQHGANELTHSDSKRWWQLLADQFKNILVLILVVAAGLSYIMGDAKDAVAILVIVGLNAALGFKQEFSAERAMEALKKMSVPLARVRRDGETQEVEARDLVPGDIVLLEAGNLVPADGRLLESASLRVQEAALTGESESVNKHVDAIAGDTIAVGDRQNMAFMGTVVTYGRGALLVTGTGMQTELGHVATLLSETEDEQTPLARKIAQVGHILIAIAMVLIGLVAVMGLARGEPWKVIFLTAVSMAVAAVPEGLPAVVTIALALGAKRMLARQALIRSLPAVETLGAVTAICTDKTGTLTQNVMTVTSLQLPGRAIDLSARQDSGDRTASDPEAALLLSAAALCTDASIRTDETTGEEVAIGDPTETALVQAALRAGHDKAVLAPSLPRIAEAPFDSDRKRMTTVHALASPVGDDVPVSPLLSQLRTELPEAMAVAFSKGAVGSILDVASSIRLNGTVAPLDDARRAELIEAMDGLAGKGIRVLAVAYRPLDTVPQPTPPDALERDLVVLGLVGMMDPLRDEVRDAVHTCTEAGIRPVIITGDHPKMAAYIGGQLGIAGAERVMTGQDLAALDQAGLVNAVQDSSIFARVSPEDKLRIVDALQAGGDVVSMTGDGVNDAPALKSADIGVAMGITGTDVAKGAADMILLDDSYRTIVSAVREGRVIFDNIRRFIRFILASNTGELLVMLLAPFFGMPLPLLPVQILWMNLVTDGLPALALGVEKAEGDVMRRPPRDPKRPIIDRAMAIQVVVIGLLMAVVSLWVGHQAWDGVATAMASAGHGHGGSHDASTWQTMLFTTMVFTQLFLALAVRSDRDSIFKIGLFSNRPLVMALAATVLLQVAVIYVPVCQGFFVTTALTGRQLVVSIAAAAVVGIAVELHKLVRRRLASHTP